MTRGPGEGAPQEWRWWRCGVRGQGSVVVHRLWRRRGHSVESVHGVVPVAAPQLLQAHQAAVHRVVPVLRHLNQHRHVAVAVLSLARYFSFAPVGFQPGLVRVK